MVWFGVLGVFCLFFSYQQYCIQIIKLNELFYVHFFPSYLLYPSLEVSRYRGVNVNYGIRNMQISQVLYLLYDLKVSYLLPLRLHFFICRNGPNYAYIMDQDSTAPGIPPFLITPIHKRIEKVHSSHITYEKTEATTLFKSH